MDVIESDENNKNMSCSSDSDDDCYYEMKDQPICFKSGKSNQSANMEGLSEPSSPVDELEEHFFEVSEDTMPKSSQAYIDEPLTPSDEINPNFRYSMMTQDEYHDSVMKFVEHTKNIVQLPETIVKILLNYYKWDESKLLEEFYDRDREELFRKANIVHSIPELVDTGEQTNLCLICCSDEPEEMFHLQCKHTFCHGCWKTYLYRQINNEGVADKIQCPDDRCQVLVDDQTIKYFLGDDLFIQHVYRKLLINSYVDNNPRTRWCPGKGCGYIVNATSLTSSYNYAQLIVCTNCQISFCFHCAQPWHDPIKCKLLIAWNRRLFDDSQNVIWIKANAKSCPKCFVSIEKNGGCNHMTCRHCFHEFCWICFGVWSSHNDCNRFDEMKLMEMQQAENARILARFVHYHDRFRNHEHSLELEQDNLKNFRKNLQKKPLEIAQNDVHLVERAFDILLKCRQMLTYTYPFAYYLKKNNQSACFEDNQADVERACEELSHLLEKNLLNETIMNEYRLALKEKHQYCELRKSVLLQHVKEGYTLGYWEYNSD